MLASLSFRASWSMSVLDATLILLFSLFPIIFSKNSRASVRPFPFFLQASRKLIQPVWYRSRSGVLSPPVVSFALCALDYEPVVGREHPSAIRSRHTLAHSIGVGAQVLKSILIIFNLFTVLLMRSRQPIS